MIFNSHFHLKDKHAFLSPSKYHWINYDLDKLDRVYANAQAAARGSQEHELAHTLIKMGIKLPNQKKTLNQYVNDAIRFRMAPEKTLYYSDNAFGHCDAISFRRGLLRIHDLKTGVSPTSEHQLEVYAALFCLEYDVKPMEIDFELRIYQNNEARIFDTDPDFITHIMDKIKVFDMRIEAIREEVAP